MADGIAWAQAQAVPHIVDGMLPYIVESVVPRLIEGVMPEFRTRVLPAVIDDLTHDSRLRDFMLEQSKGAVGDARQHLRATTTNADDRVEKAFRRLWRGHPRAGNDIDASATRPGETQWPPTGEATIPPDAG